VLSDGEAVLPLRAARSEIVSIRGEMSALLYAGVLAVSAGAGLLVKENFGAIGPVGIALGLALAASLALVWVARKAPAFSWLEVPSPNLAFDYLLLLGLLLAASDLAYVEFHFMPLGAAWPWHLLIVSLATAVFAVRYDSRIVFSLSLGTFAVWRGVSVSYLEWSWWRAPESALRANMLVCGAIFAALGALLARTGRKAHFEPVAANIGWLLVLGSLLSGAFENAQGAALAYAALLLVVAGALATWALRSRRFPLFLMGVAGAYAGLSGLVLRAFEPVSEAFVLVWFALSALVLLGALAAGHGAMRRKP
jgi:hypothetical protein